MRNLKFRAWSKREEVMRDVIAINFHTCRIAYWGEYVEYIHIDFSDVILLQYTGLKDKNGKEIYEGDIIEFNWLGINKCEIIFDNGSFCPKGWSYKTLAYPKTDIKIIGNIYENPDLLEVK